MGMEGPQYDIWKELELRSLDGKLLNRMDYVSFTSVFQNASNEFSKWKIVRKY